MLTHVSGTKFEPAATRHRYVWLFVAVLAAAGFLSGAVHPVLTLCLHGALLLFLLVRAQFLSGRERDFYIALALVPIVPISSLALFVWTTLPFGRHVPVAVLLLLGTFVAARVLGYRLVGVLRPRALLYLPLFVVTGLVSGSLAHFVMQPTALTASLTFSSVLWPALGLTVVAISEELLFRGVLLTAAVGLLGPKQGVALATLVYASLLLGQQPWLLVGLALLLGLGFGWLAFYRRSVIGVSLAHSVALVTLFIVLPNVLQRAG